MAAGRSSGQTAAAWCGPTFADVLVLQPQLPLDLLVGVPDGAGLLEPVHGLLDEVVPELPQDGHKVAAERGSVQGVDGRGERCRGGRGENNTAMFYVKPPPLQCVRVVTVETEPVDTCVVTL